MSLFKFRKQELKIVLTYSEVSLLNYMYLETILSIKLTLCEVKLRV